MGTSHAGAGLGIDLRPAILIRPAQFCSQYDWMDSKRTDAMVGLTLGGIRMGLDFEGQGLTENSHMAYIKYLLFSSVPCLDIAEGTGLRGSLL